jgi:hypothetical protein
MPPRPTGRTVAILSVEKKMIGRVPVALLCILCWAAPMPALAAVEEATAKPRTYADPEGRFGFQLSGEWVKLPADA